MGYLTLVGYLWEVLLGKKADKTVMSLRFFPPLNNLQKSHCVIVGSELNESNGNCSQTHSTFQENKG